MAMSSDLKHVLENVLPTERVIKLDSPIEFTFISSGTIHKIVSVYKKGRAWKMVDDFSNEWTISTIHFMFQSSLYYSLLSMYDSRVKPRPTNPNYPLSL